MTVDEHVLAFEKKCSRELLLGIVDHLPMHEDPAVLVSDGGYRVSSNDISVSHTVPSRKSFYSLLGDWFGVPNVQSLVESRVERYLQQRRCGDGFRITRNYAVCRLDPPVDGVGVREQPRFRTGEPVGSLVL